MTDTTIKLGALGILTGPFAADGVDTIDGLQLYIDYINEKGGVKGRKLVLTVEDYALDTAKGITAYNRMQNDVLAFALVQGSTLIDALDDRVNVDDKVPVLLTGFGAAQFLPPRPYVFGASAIYEDYSWVLAKFIAENLDAKGKRVALARLITGSSEGLPGAWEQAAAKYGLVFAGELSYPATTQDYASYAVQLAQMQPDYVALFGQRALLPFAREMKRINRDVTFLFVPGTFQYSRIAESTEAGYDIWVASSTAPYAESVPGYALLGGLLAQKFGEAKVEERLSDPLLLGWLNGMMIVAALEQAEDLTRASLRDALAQVELDTAGITGSFTTSPTRHIALTQFQIMKLEAATKQFDRDTLTPWIGSDNPAWGE